MFKVRKFDARTLAWWYRQKDSIDFEPPYQRQGGVWSNRSKAFLIDSIINGFDVPKIYIADFTYTNSILNKKNLPYAVIDGRQRLESIFTFLSGSLKLNSDFVYQDNPEIDMSGMNYNEIKNKYPTIAYDIIDQFNLDVMSVVTDDEAKIRELFVRLNQGASLRGAEIRNALTGAIPEMVRSICESELFRKCSFNKKRGQDKNTAAKILLIECNQGFANTKKTDLDSLFANGTTKFPNINESFYTVLDILSGIASHFDYGDPALKSEAPLVAYYWFFRTHGQNDKTIAFIKNFSLFRSEYKKSTTNLLGNYDDISPALLKFDALIRNANDAYGLRGAFEVIESLFLHKVEFPVILRQENLI